MENKTCCGCKGKCCKYITIEIKEPKTKQEIDTIRWYLLHKGVEIFIEDGVWNAQFNGKCKKLGKDFRCMDYENRPDVCRDHSIEICERYDKTKYTCFRNTGEFDDWIKVNIS